MPLGAEHAAGVELKVSQSNNGMHPTANSDTSMRETPANHRFVAAGDAGR